MEPEVKEHVKRIREEAKRRAAAEARAKIFKTRSDAVFVQWYKFYSRALDKLWAYAPYGNPVEHAAQAKKLADEALKHWRAQSDAALKESIAYAREQTPWEWEGLDDVVAKILP